MQTKHTPAPWISQETQKGYKIVDGFGFTISVVEVGKYDKETNAKLIAAAPEMLETLIKALEQLDNGFAVEAGMIQEAINKATL